MNKKKIEIVQNEEKEFNNFTFPESKQSER